MSHCGVKSSDAMDEVEVPWVVVPYGGIPLQRRWQHQSSGEYELKNPCSTNSRLLSQSRFLKSPHQTLPGLAHMLFPLGRGL